MRRAERATGRRKKKCLASRPHCGEFAAIFSTVKLSGAPFEPTRLPVFFLSLCCFVGAVLVVEARRCAHWIRRSIADRLSRNSGQERDGGQRAAGGLCGHPAQRAAGAQGMADVGRRAPLGTSERASEPSHRGDLAESVRMRLVP